MRVCSKSGFESGTPKKITTARITMIFTSAGSDWSWIWVAAWMMASRMPTTAAAIGVISADRRAAA